MVLLRLAKFKKLVHDFVMIRQWLWFAAMPFKVFFFCNYLRYGGDSVSNHPTGLHPFNASAGDFITNQYYMGGDCE